MGGVDEIHMPPGSRVLYLGAASGTTVSHVSDVVGPVSVYHYCLVLISLYRETARLIKDIYNILK